MSLKFNNISAALVLAILLSSCGGNGAESVAATRSRYEGLWEGHWSSPDTGEFGTTRITVGPSGAYTGTIESTVLVLGPSGSTAGPLIEQRSGLVSGQKLALSKAKNQYGKSALQETLTQMEQGTYGGK